MGAFGADPPLAAGHSRHLCPTRVLRTDEWASGASASKLASLRTPLVRDFVASRRIRDGGGGGIRTHDTLLTYTGFRDRRLQPLGHPSRKALNIAAEERCFNRDGRGRSP